MPKKASVTRKTNVEKFRHKVVVKAKTKGQKYYIQDIKNNDIIFCTGPAGTGKTTIAVGMALQYLLDPSSGFTQIVIMRPVREACGESIGFLPGSLDAKLLPWAAPVVDNMKVFIDSRQISNLFAMKKIEIIPLAYLRGRSLNHSFIIVDESQNLTSNQVLMVLTRIGKGSKMVLNGDIDQSDIQDNGILDATKRLNGLECVAFAQTSTEDIVRNPLISKIIDRYSDN